MGIGIVYCWQTGWRNRHILRTLLLWAVLSIVFGVYIGADNHAHIGGLVSGGLLTWIFPPEKVNRRGPWRRVGLILGRATMAAIAASFVLAISSAV